MSLKVNGTRNRGSAPRSEKRRFGLFVFLSRVGDGCGSRSSSQSASFTTFPNFEPIRLTKLASSPFSLLLSSFFRIHILLLFKVLP